MQNYASKEDFIRLETEFNELKIDFHESKKEIIELSKEFTKEAVRFSLEINRLSTVLDEMQKKIGKLIDVNTFQNGRSSVIREVILKAPYFVTSAFFIFCFTVVAFTTSHRDLISFIKAVVKARYGES